VFEKIRFHSALRLSVAALVLVAGCDLFSAGVAEDPQPPPGTEPPPPPPPPSGQAIVAPQGLSVPEGGTSSLAVRLAEAPTGNVTVTAEFVGGSPVFTLEGPTSLVFTPSNWESQQTVSVRSATDGDTQSDWARLRLSADSGQSLLVDVTQADSEGTPVSTQGVNLKVKDVGGVGALGYPVTAVIPLEYGKFQDTNGFRILDPAGESVAAQFEVVNRWWARDGSIRHVAVHFQATVPPGGMSLYAFETTGGNVAPAKGVTVSQAGSIVTVDTGALKFTVNKDAFNLLDEVWLDTNGDGSYATSERIVNAGASTGPVFTGRLAGDIQRARDRNDLRLVVEETGPMRAVIRVSGLTRYVSTTNHTHGFAVRLYAYAGQSMVKVDYQLQNSAKNVRHSWPLYFEDVSLNVKPNLTSPTVRIAPQAGNVWSGSLGSGRYLFQDTFESAAARNSSDNGSLKSGTNERGEPSYGWADVSDSQRGVFVTIRRMAQMWPNGIEVKGDGEVAVRLWPKWSAQYHNNSLSSTGLYWLEDMQHVYKEALLWFHGPDVSSNELDNLARNFETHPIPFVPTSWYDRTRVTLDLDGILPSSEPEDEGDTKKMEFYREELDPGSSLYTFGWRDFGSKSGNKGGGAAGGWPMSSACIVGTERIDRWLMAEYFILDDLNCRPESLAEYRHADDFEVVQPVQRYSSQVWRWPEAELLRDDGPYLAAPYLSGTGWSQFAVKDNQHLWTYNVEEFYYFSYNLWIKDWYQDLGQLRLSERFSTTLSEHWWNAFDFSNATRGEAHTWGNLLQCYRVTGDPDLLEHIKSRMNDSLWPARNLQWGVFKEVDANPFEKGFMARAMICLMMETRGGLPQLHDQAFQIMWGLADWNSNVATWCYWYDPTKYTPGTAPSSGSSTTLADAVAWFGLKTGNTRLLDEVRTYVTEGVNGGERAYGQIYDWSNDMDTKGKGGWLGRVVEYSLKYAIQPNPPAAISDLTAAADGAGRVRIQWTTPARAKRVYVVWAEKPFHTSYNLDTSKANPWAGMPVGNTLQMTPGVQQSLTFDAPSGRTVYVVVYTFDAEDAMSTISNTASVDVP